MNWSPQLKTTITIANMYPCKKKLVRLQLAPLQRMPRWITEDCFAFNRTFQKNSWKVYIVSVISPFYHDRRSIF